MKIAFIHDWPVHWQQEYDWRDGLCAAVKELSKRHELKFFVCGEDNVIPHPYFPIYVSSDIKRSVSEFTPDVILMWGDTTRPNAQPLSELGIPMALCFAGGSPFNITWQYFQHFFVESQSYFDEFASRGVSVSRAFGTNTELFQPIKEQAKIFDSIFPATFCLWKRHKIFSEATKGLTACAVGYMIPGGQESFCYDFCLEAGNLVLPHVSAEALRRLYAASRTCVITSMRTGGSQRTVLEAMAMNIPVIAMEDSDKTSEYVREGGGEIVPPLPASIRLAIEGARYPREPINTREYILSKWTHVHYADALEKGLKKICA